MTKRKSAKKQLNEVKIKLKESKFHLQFIENKIDKLIDLTELNSLMRKRLIEIKSLL